MTPARHAAIVIPGAGVVVRWPSGVVVIGGSGQTVDSVLDALLAGSDEPPAAGRLIERLRNLERVDLGAAVSTPAGIRLLRAGAGQAHVVAPDHPIPPSPEYDVAETSSPIWIGIGDPPLDELARRRPHHDLGFGVVPGAGVVLHAADARPPEVAALRPFQVLELASAAPAQARRPLPTAAPAPAAASAASPSASPAATADDSVSVLGIECSRRHFNNPRASYCQVCGISMVHLTHHLVPGRRPTLGFLVFDNGTTYALDRSYLIGREPTPEPGSGLDPLITGDTSHTVSREHAELVLDGWDVVLSDLGSTNGTFHWDTVTGRWERVLPNRSVTITPGTSVALGRRTFVYESVARPT